jgi:hypothetical protein
MKTIVTAKVRMKALVVSRLLMGELTNWAIFEKERKTATQVANRRTARSVSSQIGRGYQELSAAIRNFIDENFAVRDYDALARLCDEIEVGPGLSLRLDEFERKFIPLAERAKRRFPSYAHVHISTYGLQFEFQSIIFLAGY